MRSIRSMWFRARSVRAHQKLVDFATSLEDICGLMILTAAEHLQLAKAYEKMSKDKKVSPEAREHAARWAKNHHLLSQRASELMQQQSHTTARQVH